jgi:Cupin domain
VPEVAYQLTTVDDLDRIPVAGTLWRPIRRALGMTGVAVNAYTGARAGDEVIEPHDETSPGAGAHEELYVVVSGEAAFEIDGERVDAPAGTMILIDVGTKRAASATADETTVLVIGAAPGAALPVSPFEHWYAAEPAYLAGDYERAYEIAAAGLADYPEHPTLNYQLACYRALAGDADGALGHIRVAAEANPEVLEWAAGDDDLASIRDLADYPG